MIQLLSYALSLKRNALRGFNRVLKHKELRAVRWSTTEWFRIPVSQPVHPSSERLLLLLLLFAVLVFQSILVGVFQPTDTELLPTAHNPQLATKRTTWILLHVFNYM